MGELKTIHLSRIDVRFSVCISHFVGEKLTVQRLEQKAFSESISRF